MIMKTISQEKQILKYLQSGRSLTPLQALSKFDSLRLSARILRLRKAGNDIKDKWIDLPGGKRVKAYYID